MNYELAKKLKDTGFPQNKFRKATMCPCSDFTVETHGTWLCQCKEFIIEPTLEELIEACGYEIPDADGDNIRFCLYYTGPEQCWSAGYYLQYLGDDTYIDSRFHPQEFGKTPKEAVANLWLELNKKQ